MPERCSAHEREPAKSGLRRVEGASAPQAGPRRCPRHAAPGLNVARLPRDGLTELFVTVSPVEGEEPSEMFRRLDDFLRDNSGARIVSEDVFGGARPENGVDPVEWPVTRVLEEGTGAGPAGIQLHAVVSHRDGGAPVRPIRMGGRVVGTVFEDAYARYCLLGDIRPDDRSASRVSSWRETQARRVFEMMDEALAFAGMDFSNVVRTWLYLDDILAWYGDLNEARASFFTERGVFDGLVPASTGVGGANPAGTAIMAEAFAVAPADDRARVRAVPSPLQCPAIEYGSSFSRAVELSTPDHRRLFVSGTASIGPDGDTRHVGDIDSQIDLTMRVVHAILESRGMDWPCVTRAVCYVKPGEDASAFARYCARRRLAELPVVALHNDICRDELLFEIEVDAVVPG